MICLLSGAKKNIGDFLISERAERLLRSVTSHEVVRLPNWELLDDHLDVLRTCDGVVVAGGPGYRPDMYGGVYPLTREPAALAALGIPVSFLGLGWKGDPGDDFDLAHYRFSDRTLSLISTLGASGRYSSRDRLSQRVLERNGVPHPVMSGCPVWYDLDSIGRSFEAPQALSRIVFTPPEQPVFHPQSKDLLQALVRTFPDAEIVVAFHRGIEADRFTSEADAERLTAYAEFARALGCDVRDVSYDLERIAFYRDFDLHVGYRLHAHLCFMSYRKVSILLEEDGRGRGASEALATPGVRAWELTGASRMVRRLNSPLALRAAKRLRRPLKVARPGSEVLSETISAIDRERDAGYPSFSAAARRIDERFPTMREFVSGTVRQP
jgi:hypothetical protein